MYEPYVRFANYLLAGPQVCRLSMAFISFISIVLVNGNNRVQYDI